MACGKSIKLFLVNGTVDSIITVELSNWSGSVYEDYPFHDDTLLDEEIKRMIAESYDLVKSKKRMKIYSN